MAFEDKTRCQMDKNYFNMTESALIELLDISSINAKSMLLDLKKTLLPLFFTGELQERFGPIILSLLKKREALRYLCDIHALDSTLFSHSVEVCVYSGAIVSAIGAPTFYFYETTLAGLFHDAGKTTIPVEMLKSKKAYLPLEHEIMHKHPINGAEVINEVYGVENKRVIGGILYHHERLDGKGYPAQIRGASIPQIAQIVAIADVFSAATGGRSFGETLSFGEALREIKAQKNSFNRKLLRIFVKSMRSAKAGTLCGLRQIDYGAANQQHDEEPPNYPENTLVYRSNRNKHPFLFASSY